MFEVKYSVIKHIRYEVESDAGKRVFIIPYVSGVPDMKNVLCLSDTSLEIWEMIVNAFSHSRIVGNLCETYHKERSCIENDVREYINDLIEKKYISILEQGANDD